MDESLKDIKEEEEGSDLAQDVGNVSLPFSVPRQLLAAQLVPYHIPLTDRCSLAVLDHRRSIFSSNQWLK